MMPILDYLDGILYYPILVVVLTAAGLYFTCRTGLVQFRMFWESIRLVMEKPQNEGAVSPFHALMVSTASRVGTGNILGVSTAICLGGPGSVFWMWVIAVIGGASAFIESTLAQVYKRRDSKGDSYGGPLITSNPPCTTAPLAYFSLSSSSSPMPAASICLPLIICSPLLRHTAGMIRLSHRGLSVPFSARL